MHFPNIFSEGARLIHETGNVLQGIVKDNTTCKLLIKLSFKVKKFSVSYP